MKRTKHILKNLKIAFKFLLENSIMPLNLGLYDITHGIDFGTGNRTGRKHWWKDDHYTPIFGDVIGWMILPFGIIGTVASSALFLTTMVIVATFGLIALTIAVTEDVLRPIKDSSNLQNPNFDASDNLLDEKTSKKILKTLKKHPEKHFKSCSIVKEADLNHLLTDSFLTAANTSQTPIQPAPTRSSPRP